MFPPSKSHHHLHTLTEVFTLAEVFLNLTEVFPTLTEDFPCFFLSCKTNARVKLAKTGHGPHSSALFHMSYLYCSMYCLYVNVYCQRVTTQLQLINILSYHDISVMELGHLLTRSGLTYPEVSLKVCYDSFCQLGNSVSLPWVIVFHYLG